MEHLHHVGFQTEKDTGQIDNVLVEVQNPAIMTKWP